MLEKARVAGNKPCLLTVDIGKFATKVCFRRRSCVRIAVMLHEKIKGELKEAMKEKNAVKLSVVRNLLAAFTNEAVTRGHKPDQLLTDEEALAVIKRLAKQRQDSIRQFTAGGRGDLAEAEQAEFAYLETYLPTMMGPEEIKPVVEKVIAALGLPAGRHGATTKADAGKVIGAAMKELKNRADGAAVKAVVDELLK